MVLKILMKLKRLFLTKCITLFQENVQNVNFHDEPQCAAVCPVDCCIPDDNHVESEETLLNRQAFLHNE
jgi:hypothetical protein